MFRIHGHQERAFQQVIQIARFEDEAVPFFQQLIPRHTQLIGETGLRRVIRIGIERGSRYGIRNHGLLRFYIELMFCFGSMFDVDPLLPWAGAVLRDPAICNEITRAKRLYDAMTRYLDVVADPGTAMSMTALRAFKRLWIGDHLVNTPDFPIGMYNHIRSLYPERCDYLGKARILNVISRGPETAFACGLGTDRGVALTIALMFVIGHGFSTDPLQPWIMTTLEAPNITSTEQRVARLEQRAHKVLDGLLLYLEGVSDVQS